MHICKFQNLLEMAGSDRSGVIASQGRYFLLAILLFQLTGCVGINAIHHKARAGDTVFLALGSATGMSRDNLTVTYVPGDGSGEIDLTGNVRALFRLYPDKTSPLNLNNASSLGHEPWLVTMGLDLPYPMPVGAGIIKVICTPPGSCTYPQFHPHINGIGIGLEILPGQGTPNPFAYRGAFGIDSVLDLKSLEASPQLVLMPSRNAAVSAATRFGAAKISINAPVRGISGGPVPDEHIKVIPADLTAGTNSQRQLSWSRSGDIVTVFLVSPSGMKYLESSLSIVLHSAGNNVQPTFTAQPVVVSSTYYDMDGRAVDGPTLTVSLQ